MSTESYLPTIGLEVHAELDTLTKMFCSCGNAQEAALPNIHICPICMGHPGTLPHINKKAVESVVMVGIALNSTIATYTEFDRKNYFYPDIPKGYQISQYAYPLVRGGELEGVEITRVHLEEDTARSLHEGGDGSLVDYNRAGVPLMELVTEPVIHDAKTAARFGRELQLLLRALGVSTAHMEKGQMRVEANISVGKGGVLGTKVEVKNLNSFKSVEMAIDFEIARHIELLEKGESIVQETRGWDETKSRTFSQRKKESSHDYRYFPDPDLPKIDLSLDGGINISRITEMMPETPSKTRIKYENLGLPRKQIEVIIENQDLKIFFENLLSLGLENEIVHLSANYLTSDILGLLAQDQNLTIAKASSRNLATLMNFIKEGTITSRVAKDLLKEVVFEGADIESLISSKNLGKTDEKELIEIINQVIAANPTVVAEYKSGKVTALQFLIGQGMKATRGAGDPETIKAILIKNLG
ncbi:Asp-tRNA(Asn)/Glu-tRNA(Gln) amidotransferase subunit GatB [Patescibacteria group bacterium]|nr:Asp-tRNA(Asn)/Glu-tRNA(Gln) amidotransferase subunit GatB [Patescibacteria group bacterium]